ncbi:MAG TPA: tetratricopeptide repeat protein [Usitatibacter sp.]|nr:tetratricopeptide repeat protein [Usitatibacter sp.]
MSLLLDALRRAEQEKLARGASPNPDASLSAQREAPTPRMAPVSSPGSLELQPIGGAAPTLGHGKPDPAAQSAHVVFQAKAPPAPEPRSRGMIWATIGAIAVVVIAAGAYVWYSVQSLAPQMAAQSRTRPAPAPLPPPAGAPAATIPDLEPAVRPSAPLPSAATVAPVPPPVPSAPVSATPPPPAEDPIARVLRESAIATEAPPLRLDRSGDGPRQVPAQVATAYEALRQGNLAAARRGYESALAADPSNLDARLGLATIEGRGGNRAAAAQHYRRVLESDPRNGTAAAGLAALADFSRPEALEGQLRADLERTPRSGALRLTLGSLLAAQGRWHEAQAEFFEAHRLEPGNADVMYNLAVSLDHLGQAPLAASFYRQALDAASVQGAQFDPAPVARRLAEIR